MKFLFEGFIHMCLSARRNGGGARDDISEARQKILFPHTWFVWEATQTLAPTVCTLRVGLTTIAANGISPTSVNLRLSAAGSLPRAGLALSSDFGAARTMLGVGKKGINQNGSEWGR
jgi:hypothetical protein